MDQLESYIRDILAKGGTPDVVRHLLIGAGWQEEQFAPILNKVIAELPTPAPIQEPPAVIKEQHVGESKRNLAIPVFAGSIIVLALIGAGYTLVSMQKPLSASPTPTPEVSHPTTWQTYRNVRSGYELSFPPEWEQVTVPHSSYEGPISYVGLEHDQIALFADKDRGQTKINRTPLSSLEIQVATRDKSTLSEWISSYYPNVKAEENKALKIFGAKVWEINPPENSSEPKILFLENNSFIYIFSVYAGSDAVKNEETLGFMLQSFRVVKEPDTAPLPIKQVTDILKPKIGSGSWNETRLLPAFAIPNALSISINEKATAFDVSALKSFVPGEMSLLTITPASGVVGNSLNGKTIMGYSPVSMTELVKAEQDRAAKGGTSYTSTALSNTITYLKWTGTTEPYKDPSIKPFEEIYFIDVQKDNSDLTNGVRCFIIVPTNASSTELDVLKKNIRKLTVTPIK